MQRISVVGSSGSGKSTVARALAEALSLPLLELDSVFHQPGWTPLPDDEFRHRVRDFAQQEGWVIDGNYTSHGIADIVWPQADTIVWLDVPRRQVMKQVIGRTVKRAITRETLWNENREGWHNFLDPRPEYNIIVWAWARHRGTHDKYVERSQDGSWSHATLFRLQSRDEIRAFLQSGGLSQRS
jgi:adenylate kinase family enzyme